MGKMNNVNSKRIMIENNTGHSCILCGKADIKSGTIFRGRTVCSECLDLVSAIPVEITALPSGSAYAV